MPFPETAPGAAALTAQAPPAEALLQPLDSIQSAALAFPPDHHAALLATPLSAPSGHPNQPGLAASLNIHEDGGLPRVPGHQSHPHQHVGHHHQPPPQHHTQQQGQHQSQHHHQNPHAQQHHGNPPHHHQQQHQQPHHQPHHHQHPQQQHHAQQHQHPQHQHPSQQHHGPPQHHQPPHAPQQQHQQQQQQQPNETVAGSYTYANLTDGIISHIFFPLVVKKIFEIFTDRALPAELLTPHFDNLEQRALDLKSYGEVYGLEGACEKYASVDLFMSAMVSSLASLRPRMTGGAIDALLADTLTVAREAVRGPGMGPPPGANSSLLGGADGDRLLDRLGLQSPGVGKGSGLDSRAASDALSAARRRKLKPAARRCLEDWFQSHLDSPYPNDTEKQALAAQCGLDVQQVNNFFGNKRMRMKRKMMALHPNATAASVISPKGPPKEGSPSVLAPQSKWENVVLSKLESPVARQALGVDARGSNAGAQSGGASSVTMRPSTRGGAGPHRVQHSQGIDKQHAQSTELMPIRPLPISPIMPQTPGTGPHAPGPLGLGPDGHQQRHQDSQQNGRPQVQNQQAHEPKQHPLRPNRFTSEAVSRESTAPDAFYCDDQEVKTGSTF